MTWKKMDLHLHTPASSDYRDPGISYLDILKKAEEKGLDMIAFADHNTVGGYASMHREIETLSLLDKLGRINEQERSTLGDYRRLLDKIVVLPAFEFTATFGFHILGIFPENTSVRKLEYLLLDLNVPEERMVIGAPEVGSTSDVLRAYQAITAAGGLAIAAHANSSNGVAMQGFPFGGQTKIAYTQDPNLVALEVTDLESSGRRTTASFFNGSKPEYPRRMHLIQGSDAHSLETEQADSANKRLGVGARITEILVKEASFAALKELLTGSDFTRTRAHRSVSGWEFAERARQEGPGPTQSFHERAATKTSRTRPVLHDVAAFANTRGGTIFIGANPDVRVAVHGIERPDEDVRLLKADLQHTIEPPIDVEFNVKQVGTRAVITIQVPEGSQQPYVYTPTGQIFIRNDAETVVARRDEIISLVRKAAGMSPQEPRAAGYARPSVAMEEAIESDFRATPPAAPVPAVPQQGTGWAESRNRGREDQRSERGDLGGRRDVERRDAEARQAAGPAPERAHRPPAFPNLPPEKIKGRVQPMGGAPGASQGADTDSLSWGDLDGLHLERDQITAPLSMEQLEQDTGAGLDTMPELESPTARSRSRRGRRGAAQAEAAPEQAAQPEPQAAAPQAEETRAAKTARGKGRRGKAAESAEAAPAELPPMEATVASEHKTREELVEEAAQPKRGRRGSARGRKEQMEVEAPTAAAAASDAGAEAILTAAEVEPGPQVPAELAPQPDAAKGRSRRKKDAKDAAPQAEEAAPEPAPAEAKKPRRGRKQSAAAESAPQVAPPDPPSTGVEIISTEKRGGTSYHTMRDLRNQTTVHNVTRHSARRLWHYAIMQQEHGGPAMAEVMWHPDAPVGLWRRGDRAGATRYDLVLRLPDNSLSIYYGVTEDGLHGPWLDLLSMAEDADYWGPDASS
jgi:hypothetical protein